MELESYYNFTYIWKKRVFRFVLGMQQLIYLPLINLLWLLVGFLFFNLYKTKNIISLSLKLKGKILEAYNITFIAIFLLLLFSSVILIIQLIGQLTAIKDEANVYRILGSCKHIRNEPPILIKKKRIKGTKIIAREFYTKIPLRKWNDNLEAILDSLNSRDVREISYGGKHKNNGNKIYFETVKGRTNLKGKTLYDEF